MTIDTEAAVFLFLLPQLAGGLGALFGVALYFRWQERRKRYVCRRCCYTLMTKPGVCSRCTRREQNPL